MPMEHMPPREVREARRRFMIAGEHVILRAFEPDDAERCYRWMNDPNIVRTLTSRYPITFQKEVEWLERAMQPKADERHFAIERKDDRSHMNLTKLRIKIFDYNKKAKHVLATHGFVQEGTLRRDFYREGTYHDLVILSAFRDGVPEVSLQ
jgi:RimJ/RimL family protein N-acetyltransferase